MVNAEGGKRTSGKAVDTEVSFAAWRPLLLVCGGYAWVRFIRRIGVLRGVNAFFLASFRNFAFRATRGSAPVGHGDARNLGRIPYPWAATRPSRYITRRVIGGRGEVERTGNAGDYEKVSVPAFSGVTVAETGPYGAVTARSASLPGASPTRNRRPRRRSRPAGLR